MRTHEGTNLSPMTKNKQAHRLLWESGESPCMLVSHIVSIPGIDPFPADSITTQLTNPALISRRIDGH
jgi:hypothetical protein